MIEILGGVGDLEEHLMHKRSIQYLNDALFDVEHQSVSLVVVFKDMHETHRPDLLLELPPCDA